MIISSEICMYQRSAHNARLFFAVASKCHNPTDHYLLHSQPSKEYEERKKKIAVFFSILLQLTITLESHLHIIISSSPFCGNFRPREANAAYGKT